MILTKSNLYSIVATNQGEKNVGRHGEIGFFPSQRTWLDSHFHSGAGRHLYNWSNNLPRNHKVPRPYKGIQTPTVQAENPHLALPTVLPHKNRPVARRRTDLRLPGM